MIWVSWRQHRGQAIGTLAVVGVLAIVLVVVGNPMRAQFGRDGLTGCVPHGVVADGCRGAVAAFIGKFGFTFNQLLIALAFVPGLIGVGMGAPLLGRELEHGTWRLAWSQTVPRTRWLITKLVLLTCWLVFVGAATTAAFTWYRAPLDQLTGRFTYAAFDFEGTTLTAYLLCAFALAVLASLLARGSIGAMAVAFITWAAIRSAVDFALRPHFQQPLHIALSRATGVDIGPNAVPPMTGRIGDWVLTYRITTRSEWITYQPATRFWHFQLIETGLYLGLTLTTLAAAVYFLRLRAA